MYLYIFVCIHTFGIINIIVRVISILQTDQFKFKWYIAEANII